MIKALHLFLFLILVTGGGVLAVTLASCVALPSLTRGQGQDYDYGNPSVAPLPTPLRPGEHLTLTWMATPAPHPQAAAITLTLAIVLVPEQAFRQRLPFCKISPGDTVIDSFQTSNQSGRSYHRLIVIPKIPAGQYELMRYTDRGSSQFCMSAMVTIAGRVRYLTSSRER